MHRKNLLQWLPLALFAAVMLTVSPKADGFDIKCSRTSNRIKKNVIPSWPRNLARASGRRG